MKPPVNCFFILAAFTIYHSLFTVALAQSPRPNVLIIMADDMKWNSLIILNPDNILPTPNIDRIGNEGANIKCYSVNSLCVPGRQALLTGKYGHRMDVMNNSHYIPNSVKLLPKIFHDSGYYTALVGKWMVTNPHPYPSYFDYWLYSDNKVHYFDDTCYYFNTPIATSEHMTDFLTDSAVQLLSRIDTPFFMMLDHNAPHGTWHPQAIYEGVFDPCNFPVPLNFEKYSVNYPDFLYTDTSNLVHNVNQEIKMLRNYYEMMAGVEESVGEVLDTLTARGLLDNTIIIFTTDNSNLIGEHGLAGKQQPYNECMRMPLLIRYPPLFSAGTVMNDNFILNVDIAPTLLSLAGINSGLTMDGIPIQNFLNSDTSRTQFYYEQKARGVDTLPQVRTVRDNQFQYNRYYCTDTTEELFDEQLDTLQMINLAVNPAFQTVLYQYRNKLDSMRYALNDTMTIDLTGCHLVADTSVFVSHAGEKIFSVYPNPALNIFYVQSASQQKINYEVLNILGQKIMSGQFDFTKTVVQKIDLGAQPDAVYLLQFPGSNSDAVRLIKAD